MKKPTTIAFIGNGKLTKAFVLGFLRSGHAPEEIIVIGRESSDLSFFESIGVKTSKNVIKANGIPNIILTVTPKAVKEQLVRMKGLKIKTPHYKKIQGEKILVIPQRIISFVSGADTVAMSSFLEIDSRSIIKATSNTNIEYCNGIICLSLSKTPREVVDVFQPLGEIFFERSKNILKLVTAVGAMNAIDAKVIMLLYQNKESIVDGKIPLRRFLEKISEKHQYADPRVDEYLENKARILKRYLGYSEMKNVLLAKRTFFNTVSTLLKIKSLSLQKIEEHISKVATKGGCTEQGLGKMNSVDSLSYEKLCEIIPTIHNRAKRFREEAKI